MSIRWNHESIYPSDAMEPKKIFKKTFILGSIAGSVGASIHDYKPGINEDGGRVAYSADRKHIICIMIDGHKQRDTTEILLDTFKELVDTSSWIGVDSDFIPFCHRFSKLAISNLKEKQAIGWASYILLGIDRVEKSLHYYSVGDCMIFAHDPKRLWGPYYQIGSRHYYEWINTEEVIGYHTGRVKFNEGTRIIIVTDGVIDYPVIKMNSIEKIFNIETTECEAAALVKYALDHNLDHDDNITAIFLKMD